MVYDNDQLKAVAMTVMRIAKDNLLKDGFVHPVGLIFTTAGLDKTVEFKFKGLKHKRRVQADFKFEVMEQRGIAVIVVMETWFASQPDMPADFTKSLADYPWHKEAILVEGSSLIGTRVLMLQPFHREGSVIVLDELVIPDGTFSWESEWTSGIWDHVTEGKA
ncbi:MAG: hypothetical protein ACLP5H_03855 [Desulfomonilaceae bacterium]